MTTFTVNEPDLAPSLNRLPADSDLAKIIDVIKTDGGVILTNLISPSQAISLADELQDSVDKRQPGFLEGHDESFYGTNTIRMQSMARRSQTWVNEVLLNPVLLGLADAILHPHCGDYWLSQSELIYLGPEQPVQELHRDDLNWPLAATIPNIDLQLSCLVALGDYDAEVGATQVVPGSHLWPHDRIAQPHEIVQAEMDPGDALVYTGSTIHSGGENKTTDRWRKALYLSYLVGWLTPEEAVPLAVSPELARTLPKRARELLGHANLPSREGAYGAEAALQLWQLDEDDLKAADGSFHHR